MTGSKAAIYQTGTINSLVNAVYDGDRNISWIRTQGDFGLGALPMMDGELIVCDGVFYRADANADLSIPADDAILPFAVVSHFKPDQRLDLLNTDFAETVDYRAGYIASKNLIYTVMIDGLFTRVHLRSEKCQPKTYRKMNETMPQLQRVYEREDIDGTLVGIWYPDYLSQINVAGFHFHFVDKERTTGGHVFDFQLARGQVAIQTIKSLHVDLIDNNEFAQANLRAESSDPVNQLEKQQV